MSTPEARAEFLSILSMEHKKHGPPEKMLRRFASRRPMTQLLDQYRVTKTNPNPPLVHFAIPVHVYDLYKYADKHDLMECYRQCPQRVSPTSLLLAAKRLSEEVQYDLDFEWPFEPTADCDVLLSLHSNYTMDDKMLIDEDQEDVIQLVQEVLGLNASVRPKWYFDLREPWYWDEED